MSPMYFTGTLAQWTGAARGLPGAASVSLAGALAAAGLVKLASGHPPAVRAGAAATPQPPARAARPSLPEAVDGSRHSASGGMRRNDDLCHRGGRASRLDCSALAGLGSGARAAAGGCMGAAGGRRRRGGGVLEAWPQAPMALLCALCSFGGAEHLAAKPAVCAKMHTPREAAFACACSTGRCRADWPLLVFSLFPGLTRPF